MRWLHRWRFELLVTALAAVELVTVATADVARKPTALAITAISALVLLGRRWQPLAATIAAFAALTVSVTVMPRSTTAQFFGTLATFAIAGAVNREREAVVAWLAGVGMLAYASWVDPYGGGAADFGLSVAFGTTMWGAGLLVARRGRHAHAAIERAAQAEREREVATRRALVEERARIARELHDVVSHGLSVVVLQTLAARGALTDLGVAADDVDRHLDAVESTARDALGEMRRMLGLLQTGGEEQVDDQPPTAPGLAHLDELVNRVTTRLGQVRLRVDDDLDLPAGLELAVYRIVQEALTNVVKHAPDSDIDVSVQRGGDELTVAVRNSRPAAPGAATAPGAGRGLVGIRERVALYAGTLDAGPTPEGGYALRAVVPISGSADLRTSSMSAAP